MCGRFVIELDPDRATNVYGVPISPDFPVRYNISPSQQVPVIRQTNSERRLDFLRWGLVPAWSKEMGRGLINARAETVNSKPSFRQAFRQRRCILPASGFYEWQKSGNRKIPHYIRMANDAPMSFAGIWEIWMSAEGQPVETCAILTTEANRAVSPLHDRMPVILDVASLDLWLDCRVTDPEQLQSLLSPCPSENLVTWPVSTLVNNPGNDNPDCIKATGAHD